MWAKRSGEQPKPVRRLRLTAWPGCLVVQWIMIAASRLRPAMQVTDRVFGLPGGGRSLPTTLKDATDSQYQNTPNAMSRAGGAVRRL